MVGPWGAIQYYARLEHHSFIHRSQLATQARNFTHSIIPIRLRKRLEKQVKFMLLSWEKVLIPQDSHLYYIFNRLLLKQQILLNFQGGEQLSNRVKLT